MYGNRGRYENKNRPRLVSNLQTINIPIHCLNQVNFLVQPRLQKRFKRFLQSESVIRFSQYGTHTLLLATITEYYINKFSLVSELLKIEQTHSMFPVDALIFFNELHKKRGRIIGLRQARFSFPEIGNRYFDRIASRL